MFDDGLSRIDAIFGPQPSNIFEQGLSRVSAALMPEITYQQYSEAADRILGNDSFIESALNQFNSALGFHESYSAQELKPYVIESLQFLVEASKDKEITPAELKEKIQKRVKEIEMKPNPTNGLVSLFIALLPLTVIGAGALAYGTGYAIGSILGPLGIPVAALAGGALGYYSVDFASWLATFIYNKITGNNVASLTEKYNAVRKMISEIDKLHAKLEKEGKTDKIKPLLKIREDLDQKLRNMRN